MCKTTLSYTYSSTCTKMFLLDVYENTQAPLILQQEQNASLRKHNQSSENKAVSNWRIRLPLVEQITFNKLDNSVYHISPSLYQSKAWHTRCLTHFHQKLENEMSFIKDGTAPSYSLTTYEETYNEIWKTYLHQNRKRTFIQNLSVFYQTYNKYVTSIFIKKE